MVQQINLLTPILLAPRRHLSALTLLQTTLLLLLATLAAVLWLAHRDREAEAGHGAAMQRFASERQALQIAQAGLPAPQLAQMQQQQLQLLLAGNAERRALLQSLGTEGERAGRQHSDLLALLARSLPESAWLSELHHSHDGLELIGGTLDTAALRPWLSRLSAHPLLAGQQLSALRVEKLGTPPDNRPALLDRASPATQSSLPVWAFRVVSAPATAASATLAASGARS